MHFPLPLIYPPQLRPRRRYVNQRPLTSSNHTLPLLAGWLAGELTGGGGVAELGPLYIRPCAFHFPYPHPAPWSLASCTNGASHHHIVVSAVLPGQEMAKLLLLLLAVRRRRRRRRRWSE